MAVARIDLQALRDNLARIRELAPGIRVMAVVKADGYGHGLERVARALAAADAFGVAAIADGLRLRAAGHRNRIVVLSGPDNPADLSEMHRLGLDAVIHHPQQLLWLREDQGSPPLRVWLKIDTGMHRLGFPPEQAQSAYRQLQAMSSVHPEIVVCTHFAAADEFHNPLTLQQINTFMQVAGMGSGEQSLANSAAFLRWPAACKGWLRIGGLLYGLSVVAGHTGREYGFHPAMRLHTRLIAVNRIHKGERIGYAATWVCPADMPVGVAAIGYGDGYPRAAPSGTPVRVTGVEVPLIGRVSMDLITLDLRTTPDARIGDEVLLWGPELPVERIAEQAGSIAYELTCGITRRVLVVEAGVAG